MPQMDFYINDSERVELFDFLDINDAIIVPDLMYESNRFIEVESSKHFIELIEMSTVRFFIYSKCFSKQGFLMEQNQFIKKPTFSIQQRYGGPYINIALYRGHAADAEPKYKRTEIHYYSKYINLENYFEEIPASIELKAYFKSIVKYLKLKCKLSSIEGKKYWISKEVLKSMQKL